MKRNNKKKQLLSHFLSAWDTSPTSLSLSYPTKKQKKGSHVKERVVTTRQESLLPPFFSVHFQCQKTHSPSISLFHQYHHPPYNHSSYHFNRPSSCSGKQYIPCTTISSSYSCSIQNKSHTHHKTHYFSLTFDMIFLQLTNNSSSSFS